ncbi:MAG: hypothetical protein KGZ74_19035 [Chitinophagaceae bacterium]|nr:hypothetical protein [Chitinophagaceae bacterium]
MKKIVFPFLLLALKVLSGNSVDDTLSKKITIAENLFGARAFIENKRQFDGELLTDRKIKTLLDQGTQLGLKPNNKTI